MLPGSDGNVDKETLRRVQAVAEEYLLNGLLNEAMEVMKETVHPNGMRHVVRCLLNFFVEKKIEELEKLFPYIPSMCSLRILDKKSFHEGLVDFLDGYDDLTVDIPYVGKSTALLLSHMLLNDDAADVFDLTVFTSIPAGNLFAESSRFVDLVARILEQIAIKRGLPHAENIYRGVPDLESILRNKLMSSEEIEGIAKKYNIPFLAV